LLGCSGEPAVPRGISRVTVTGVRAMPNNTGGTPQRALEIIVTLTITNNTNGPMSLAGEDFWYLARKLNNKSWLSVTPGRLGSGTGNVSSCSTGPVGPGHSQTCTAVFALGNNFNEAYLVTDLVPGAIAWRDRRGFSDPETAGSYEIEAWTN
jgi:hypothetical protein